MLITKTLCTCAPPTAQHTHAHITCKSHGFMHNVRLLTTPAVVEIHDAAWFSPLPTPHPHPPIFPLSPSTHVYTHTLGTHYSRYNGTLLMRINIPKSQAQVIQDVCSRLWWGQHVEMWRENVRKREKQNKVKTAGCGLKPAKLRPTLVI